MTPSSELNRRRLLLGAAAAGAAAATVGTVAAVAGSGEPTTPTTNAAGPVADRSRLQERSPRRRGALSDVEQVVILMQENRSFDHYYGALRGVRGFNDRATLPNAFRQPDPAGGVMLPYHVDSFKVDGQSMDGLPHTWPDAHQAWAGGRNNDWIAAKSERTMAHFDRTDIPFQYALADAFTICDQYHCSLMGGTTPNRLHLFTGTIDPEGKAGGPATLNAPDYKPVYRWTTYPERLQEAGVSWQVYANKEVGDEDGAGTDEGWLGDYGDNPLWLFQAYHDALASSDPKRRELADRASVHDGWLPDSGKGKDVEHVLEDFRRDCESGDLPSVSWVVAPYRWCEHPLARPVDGANYVQTVLQAIFDNRELWESTIVFINYDENDGFFDHVLPPTPAPGTALEWVQGYPIGLGPRVPMTVVSPWSRGGWVNSEVFDHTSVIRFLERWTGVHEPNISPRRREVCGDLMSCFDFGDHDTGVPKLPNTTKLRAEMDQLEPHLPVAGVPPRETIPYPKQEFGTRPSRPLPYQTLANATMTGGSLTVVLRNRGERAVSLAVFNAEQPPTHHLIRPGGSESTEVSMNSVQTTVGAAVAGTPLTAAAAVPVPSSLPLAGALAPSPSAAAPGGLGASVLGAAGLPAKRPATGVEAPPTRVVTGPGGVGLISGDRGVGGVAAGVPVPVTVGGAAAVMHGYRVLVLGPNGFLREFTGAADTLVETTLTLTGDRHNPAVRVSIVNRGRVPVRATITDRLDDKARAVEVGRGQRHSEERDVFDDADGWYDLTVTLDRDSAYRWRFAGHVENGRPSDFVTE